MSAGHAYSHICLVCYSESGSRWLEHVKASISDPQGYLAKIYDFPSTDLESPTKEVQKTSSSCEMTPPQCLVWTLCREMVGYHWKTMGNHSRVCVGGAPIYPSKHAVWILWGPPGAKFKYLADDKLSWYLCNESLLSAGHSCLISGRRNTMG